MRRYRVAFHIPSHALLPFRPEAYETFIGKLNDQWGVALADSKHFWPMISMVDDTVIEPLWVTQWRRLGNKLSILRIDLMRDQ